MEEIFQVEVDPEFFLYFLYYFITLIIFWELTWVLFPLWIFKKTLFTVFCLELRLTTKWEGKRDFSYIPCTHTCIISTVINITHRIFFKPRDESTSLHQNLSKSIIYLRIHCCSFIFHGFGQKYNDIITEVYESIPKYYTNHYNIIQSV